VVNRYTYGPFGESAVLAGTTHGYTGQRYDSETGLYYYKMRHYSPKTGRFLQPDPIGMAGGMNLYAYCSNAPLTASDSTGLVSPVPVDLRYMYVRDNSGNLLIGLKELTGMLNLNVLTTMCDVHDYLPKPAEAIWINRVRPGGAWDFKKDIAEPSKPPYANFGNFNFGATAWAVGKTLAEALKGAGLANKAYVDALKYAGGKFDYGKGAGAYTNYDQPIDQWYIVAGYEWAMAQADYFKAQLPAFCKKAEKNVGRNYSVLQGSIPGTDYWNEYDGDGNLVRSYTKTTFSGFYIGPAEYTSYAPGGGGNGAGTK
jgi:RHS repeat-associated protein